MPLLLVGTFGRSHFHILLAKCSVPLYLIRGGVQICIRHCGAVLGYKVSDTK